MTGRDGHISLEKFQRKKCMGTGMTRINKHTQEDGGANGKKLLHST